MTQEVVPSYHPNIRAARDGFVVTVTIDRPESRNACTGDMWVALGRIFREVGHSGARGESSSNGSGAPSHNLDNMRVLADMVLAVHDCPVPVVNAVVPAAGAECRPPVFEGH
ncbi:hypothetical protein MXD62_35700 [Frankia sp. Mgl5]|uniref:hypothetical protein n=1 Tax=Frankia sp. Mgl5 TaxID=2933793 RepID=UPI00200C3020|nr:hypothetical protein [Frankia sp. Mgl5]MCK9932426.1 hypothetical protein [Frankia sp. Mgl5]